jgi:serine O-acetyltransferase
MGEWRDFRSAVRADHEAIRQAVVKYGSAEGTVGSLAGDAVRKVGFQLLVGYRVMRLLVGWRMPLLAQIASRIIRHLYGADIHWKADLRPGITIVHGMGLCINHGVTVDSGAILFQNVTLGEGIDPSTREVGAPHLEASVHVGPGAVLVGPITIGTRSKIMANCVVTQSVPPWSLVEAPVPEVRRRELPPGPSAAAGERSA